MKAQLAAYIIAGYPDRAGSLDCIRRSEEAGVDIFEIGYPSADPYCDGEIIRRAHEQVTKREIPDISYWREIRALVKKPLWIMAYKADFIDTGLYRRFAEEKLADVLVLPDCDEAKRLELQAELAPQKMGIMGFANPTLPADQFKILLKRYAAIYFQLYKGKTGSSAEIGGDLSPYLKTDREGQAALFAGFGIDTAEKARSLVKRGFDGVIIGTALVRALNDSKETMTALIRDISQAIKS
jgi:tryptophan synthase alpha chain